MKNRFGALLMVGAITASTLAGCGNSANSADTTGNEINPATSVADTADNEMTGSNAGTTTSSLRATSSITFPLAEQKSYTLFSVVNGQTPLDDTYSWNKMQEDNNIRFDTQSVLATDLDEKRNLVLSSGDYPDAFYKSGISKVDVDKYGKEGVFIPLEDLMHEYAPNFCALMDKINGWGYITAPDGHIYSFPSVDTNAEREGSGHMWLNKKWMDNLGLKEPTNVDELYDVLKAFKEQDANGNGDPGDEIPIDFAGTFFMYFTLPYFGMVCSNDTTMRCALINGEFSYYPTSDEYKEMLRFYAKLVNEGIMSPDSMTRTWDEETAMGDHGDVMGCFTAGGAFQIVGRTLNENYIIPLPFEKNGYSNTSGITSGGLCITDACEDPETLVAWADQFYTQEGGIFYWLGVKDKTYTVSDDGSTWAWKLDGDIGSDISTVRVKGTIQGAAVAPYVQPDFWFTGMTPDTDAAEYFLIQQRMKMLDNSVTVLPPMNYSDEQNNTIATLSADISTYIDEYTANVVTGNLDLDSTWDEYVSNLKKMGSDELFEIYTEVYNAGKGLIQ